MLLLFVPRPISAATSAVLTATARHVYLLYIFAQRSMFRRNVCVSFNSHELPREFTIINAMKCTFTPGDYTTTHALCALVILCDM